MILKQYYLGCLSQASYLIGDETSGLAAVVDPRRDVDDYLADARTLGLNIRYVLLTHFHADFISGHLELQRSAGAEIRMGSRANPEFPHVAMHDGDSIVLGGVRVTALETPGHTPESVCWLVFDGSRDAAHPAAVLTGDTLFIGDVGRPDLMASVGVTAEELAGQLYDSIHEKLLTLPDETLVYPGHGAGSMCGKNLSTETVSTLGVQRRINPALAPMSREEFVELVSRDQPAAPAYFAYDALQNRRNRPSLNETLDRSLVPLALDRVIELQQSGATVLDTRDPDAFAQGHLPGSLNIGLGGAYATWAGTLLDRESPVVILADRGREEESILRLGRIGFDHVLGYLEGGPAALGPAGRQGAGRLDAPTLAEELHSARPPVVLDIRRPGEREAQHLAGSLHIPLDQLRARLAEIPRGERVVVYCAGGYRSTMGASILRGAGHEDVTDLRGGIQAWMSTGLPVVEAAPSLP